MVNWLPVVGYEGLYEVSDDGQVRSVDRVVPRGSGTLFVRGRALIPTKIGAYQTVGLSKVGVCATRRIHNLVLEAFVGPRPEGMVACHNNGRRDDLRASNLRWDSQSANLFDAVKHGTHHNAAKVQCKRGHPFTPGNTYINPTSKGRQCRQCIRERNGVQSPRGPRSRSLDGVADSNAA